VFNADLAKQINSTYKDYSIVMDGTQETIDTLGKIADGIQSIIESERYSNTATVS